MESPPRAPSALIPPLYATFFFVFVAFLYNAHLSRKPTSPSPSASTSPIKLRRRKKKKRKRAAPNRLPGHANNIDSIAKKGENPNADDASEPNPNSPPSVSISLATRSVGHHNFPLVSLILIPSTLLFVAISPPPRSDNGRQPPLRQITVLI